MSRIYTNRDTIAHFVWRSVDVRRAELAARAAENGSAVELVAAG